MKKIALLLVFIIILSAIFSGCSLLGSKAEVFSEEDFIRAVEQAVSEKKTTLTYTCKPSEMLETQMDDALTKAYKRYLVGENVLNIYWTAAPSLRSTQIDLELEYAEEFSDDRAAAYAYSEEAFSAAIEQELISRSSTVKMLFPNDGTITDTGLEAELDRILFGGEYAVMTYYLSRTQYSVTTYDEYLVLKLTIEYVDDADVPFENIPYPKDPSEAIAATIEQWETDDTAILYLPEAPTDPEAYCSTVVTTAIANDADFSYNCETYYWNAYGTRDCIVTLQRKYDYDEAELQRMSKEVTAKAQEAAAEIASADPKDAVKEIARLLCERVAYDDPLANSILSDHELSHESNIRRTAYGALIDGTSVCTGYAKAFQLICDVKGIDCWTIDGTVDEVGHEWNAVFIDGEMYYVDVTFADTGKDKDFYLFGEELYKEEGYTVDEGFYIPAA